MKCIIITLIFLSSIANILFAQSELDAKVMHEYYQIEAKQKETLFRQSQQNPITLTANKEGYDVKYYAIDLDINPKTKTIAGSVLVRAQAVIGNLTQIDLDLIDNMTISTITQDTIALSFSHEENIINVWLAKAYSAEEIFELKINYSGTPLQTGGLFNETFVFDSYQDQPMIYNTLATARYWWPCKDYPVIPIEGYPIDKADSMDINITVPSNLVVASNGVLVNVFGSDLKKTYQWQERYPILPTSVCLLIYPYETYLDWFKYSTTDSMELQFYVYPDQYDKFYDDFSKIKEILKLYSDLFGLYPFVKEKYAMVLWTLQEWAMAFPTISAFPYDVNEFYIDYLVAHEAAHQWWWHRNLISPYHDWLSEGFCDYSSVLWREFKYGITDYHDNMNQWRHYRPGTIYLEDPENDDYDIYLIYEKGAWVLHMLRHVMGDSTFFESVQAYAMEPEFQQKLVTTEDFQAICEQVSGLDLNKFFQQWIYEEYYPYYAYGWSLKPETNGYSIKLRIDQIQNEQIQQDLNNFWMPIDGMPVVFRLVYICTVCRQVTLLQQKSS